MSLDSSAENPTSPPYTLSAVPLLLVTLLLCSLAGAMAWGIRGQYGHETGAMIFGPLVGFSIVMLYLPQANTLKGVRVVALLSMAIGIGGSMSYGETVGLTHDTAVHQTLVIDEAGEETYVKEWNNEAYWWGMLGLGIKGGLWLGFAGLFLGVGLGRKTYSPMELLGLILVGVLLLIVGIWLFNTPFEPENRILPRIYFSDHWRWEPAEFVNPRPENWGGVLLPFLAAMAYLQFIKRDRLPVLLGFWGLVGGLGFPIGQSLQAAMAFDVASFREYFPILYGINNWNMMECTFGFVAGGVLGFGVWLHRGRIAQTEPEDNVVLSLSWEVCLLVAYLYLMLVAWFLEDTQFGQFYEYGLVMAILPLVGVMGGRFWPYLYAFPIVAMPIAVKTFRAVAIAHNDQPPRVPTDMGWLLIVTFPLLLLTIFALSWAKPENDRVRASYFGACGLLASSACYFILNATFLGNPLSWLEGWRLQTLSGMIYIIAWVVLSLAALFVVLKPNGKQL
ncbi:hypothetical protein Pla110_03750 [Polystyrenella longa]|uniref:Uncharacterized protein n=1 Tax=Polystyrenella longa TaxID=2528007 RepID=A0A518CHH5_9PLAN|nr:hypothetical protein [Polystyrenella longa]QDU78671.1 hypothetical protein Pla110_03750 [Polystyrenella longa]